MPEKYSKFKYIGHEPYQWLRPEEVYDVSLQTCIPGLLIATVQPDKPLLPALHLSYQSTADFAVSWEVPVGREWRNTSRRK